MNKGEEIFFQELKTRLPKGGQMQPHGAWAAYKTLAFWIKFHPYKFFLFFLILFFGGILLMQIDVVKLVFILRNGY